MIRQQAKAARGGHRWLVVVEEELGGVVGGFRGRWIFYATRHICSLQHSPRRVWLAWADPAQIFLLRLKNPISYIRCHIVSPNGPNMEDCLRNLHTQFEDDPTFNESEMDILLK